MAKVVEALRGYDEEDAQLFIEKYDSISESDLARLSIEEICTAADVKTLDVLGCITKALVAESQTVSSILVASNHPKIVRATIKRAMLAEGHREKEMIHTATGFLPTTKGSTFINKVQVANFDGDKARGGKTIDAPTADEADLISMDDDLVAMDQFERKMLPAAK